MKLSIIIPVYNVEKYVERCILSCINQNITNLDDIELIIVNDGSTDGSLEIIERIMVDYPHYPITLLSQRNSGLSVARNTGVYNAKGEYLWFVDSDDWIADGSISIIIDTIHKYESEAIHISAADIIDGKPVKLFSLRKVENVVTTGLNILKTGNFHGVVQYTIYKKDFLLDNNLSFFKGIYHEDTEFSPRAYYYLKEVVCLDKILYYKRVNEDSITRKVNPKKNLDLIIVACNLREFAKKIDDDNTRKYYMRLSANALKMAMRNEFRCMDYRTKNLINQCIYDNIDVLNSFIESDKLIYKIQGFILKLFPRKVLYINSLLFYNKLLRKLL